MRTSDKSHTPDDEDGVLVQKLHQNDTKSLGKGSPNFLSVPRFPDDRNSDTQGHRQSRDNVRVLQDNSGHHHQMGWSNVLEEWYGHGSGITREDTAAIAQKPTSPDTPTLSSSEDASQQSYSLAPYELLEKDRLLGVYMAIYVHRDIRHLVRGRIPG